MQVPDTATAGPLEVQLCDRLLVNRVGEKDARTPKSKMAKILLVKKTNLVELILFFSNFGGQRHYWLPLWSTSSALP